MYEKDIAKYCKRLNKVIKYLHDHKASIGIPKLDCNSLRIATYSDAAIANNTDLSSLLRRIVLLTYDNNNSIPVSYTPYSSQRFVRSVLSAEVIAFADLFDYAPAIQKRLEFFLRQSIPVHILPDFKGHLDVLSKVEVARNELCLIYMRLEKHIKHKK